MKVFDADKTKMIGLSYGEKNDDNNVEPFSSNTGTLRTDGRTDRIAISISRVNVLTRDKNYSVIHFKDKEKSIATIERLKAFSVEKFTLDGRKFHTLTFCLQNTYCISTVNVCHVQCVCCFFSFFIFYIFLNRMFFCLYSMHHCCQLIMCSQL